MLNKGIHALSYFFRRFWIGAVYIFLSVIIGEHQPFTLYPMFNSFPNYANYYLMQDQTGSEVYWFSSFRCSGDEVKDMFLVRQSLEGDYENLQSEKRFAKEIVTNLLNSATEQLTADSLRLFRVDVSRNGKQINKTSILLYETAVY